MLGGSIFSHLLLVQVERLRKSKVEDAEVHEHERKQEADQLKRRNKELQEALTSSQEQLARLVDLHKQVRVCVCGRVCACMWPAFVSTNSFTPTAL